MAGSGIPQSALLAHLTHTASETLQVALVVPVTQPASLPGVLVPLACTGMLARVRPVPATHTMTEVEQPAVQSVRITPRQCEDPLSANVKQGLNFSVTTQRVRCALRITTVRLELGSVKRALF